MKKTLSCVVLSLLSVLPAAAFEEQAVENAVLGVQALQQRNRDSYDKARFENYLGLAVIKIDEKALNWDYLGPALYKAVSAVMAAEKAEDKTLDKEEDRAVYHAVCDMIPKTYREDMDNAKGYDKRFSFDPKNKSSDFLEAYEMASALVYRAVREIGMTQDGWKSWLGYLNDALVPGHHKNRYNTEGAREKARFNYYLGLAKITMNERRLNFSYLGPALFKSVSAVMAAKKTEQTLTPEEERAVYYAVYNLLKDGDCLGNMDDTDKYDARFRFNPKTSPDDQAYGDAIALVYQAVQEIGTTPKGYSTWLWYLNDALVPGRR